MGIVIRQSIKGTFWNYLGVVLGAANIMWVFPYFLTPKEIGIYRVVIDLGTLFAIFAGLGTGHIADRFYVKVKDTHRQGFIGYVCLMALVGFLLFQKMQVSSNRIKAMCWRLRLRLYYSVCTTAFTA
jgi:O-antigen/teichoic acid export membrane protein